MLLMPVYASAGFDLPRELFTPNNEDMSLAILSQLFGDLIVQAGGKFYNYDGSLYLGSGLDPFKDILIVFNIMCAIVATILFSTGGLQNLTHMAEKQQSGEFASTIWWFRIGSGATFIMPLAGGCCVLQVLVGWFMINSIGASDSIAKRWLGISGEYNLGNSSNMSTSGNFNDLYKIKMPSPQVATVVYSTAAGYTCAYGLASQNLAQEFDTKFNDTRERAVEQNKSVQGISIYDTMGAYTASRKNNPAIQTPTYHNGVDPKGMIADAQSASDVAQSAISLNKEIEQKNIEMARQRSNALRQAETQAMNQTKSNMITEENLEKVAEETFGYGNNRNWSKQNATMNGAFFFGLPKLDDVQSEHNREKSNYVSASAACGYIDFKNRNSSNASMDILRKGEAAINKIAPKSPAAKAFSESIKNGNAKTPTNKEYEDGVAEQYLKVYNKYRQQIADASRAYVNEVNQNMRFVSNKDGTRDVQSASKQEFSQKQTAALDKFNNRLLKISQNMEKDIYAEMVAYFEKTSNAKEIAAKYNFRNVDELAKQNNASGNFITSRKIAEAMVYRDGWISLGSVTMLLVSSINKAQSLANVMPSISVVSYDNSTASDFANLLGQRSGSYANRAASDMDTYYGYYDKIISRSTHPYIVESMKKSGTANSIAALAFGLDLSSMASTDRHPLIIVIESGRAMLNAVEKYHSNSAYWSGRQAGADKNANNNQRPFHPNDQTTQSMESMMTFAVAAMLMLGFMMAFYLPALPFLLWASAVLGWLVSFIEAVFVAPLWGAMHLSYGGDKLVGKAQAGYALFMALLFRAPLMVLGYIAAFTLLQVYGIYINYVYGMSMMLSLGGTFSTEDIGFITLCTVFATYGIYAYFMQIVITKIFGMITVLADQSLKWIGGSVGNLSEYSNMAGAELNGKVHSFASPFANASVAKQTANAKMAGQLDTANNVAPNTTGAGYNQLMSSGNYSITPTQKIDTPAPSGTVETARYNDAKQAAYRVTMQSGMNNDEAQQISQQFADIGWNNQELTNHMQNWGNNRVFERGVADNPNAGQVALRNAVSQARNGNDLGNSLQQNFVSKVSRGGGNAGNTEPAMNFNSAAPTGNMGTISAPPSNNGNAKLGSDLNHEITHISNMD